MSSKTRNRRRQSEVRPKGAEGGSIDVLALRLQNTKQELRQKQDEVKALKAQLGVGGDALVLRLVAALRTAAEHSNPAGGSAFEDAGSRSANPPDPGSHVRAARRAENRLRMDVGLAISAYYAAEQDEWKWKPPPEKVRCQNAHCEYLGKRVNRFYGPGNSMEHRNCGECGGRLTPA